MRLLTLLATTVLLAGCVHDTDDYNLFLAETGASLTYYIGSDGDADQKSHDDPWDTITDKFGVESVHTGEKRGSGNKKHDDPWGTIRENFPIESMHTGSGKKHDDWWVRISEQKASFRGRPISEMVFVHFSSGDEKADDPWDATHEKSPIELGKSTIFLKLKEARGAIGRFELANGRTLFAVGVPAEWESGVVLRGEAYVLDAKKMLPLMGAIIWETAPILR